MGDEMVAWLRAQLDEDERVAQDAHYEGQRWLSEEEDVCRWPDDELVHIADRKRDAAHIARHDPARVLAEVQAKRRIIDKCVELGSVEHADDLLDIGIFYGLRMAVRLLALPYAGRDGWRAEWAPDEEVSRG